MLKLLLDREKVEALFAKCPACAAMPDYAKCRKPEGCACPSQGEILTTLYRMAVPDFDALPKLNGWPVVNPSTAKAIMRLFMDRDRRVSPDVLAGGAWMNSGFSHVDAIADELKDWEVALPPELVLQKELA